MKTEALLKRLVKDKEVLFVGTAEQCERAANDLFELAREKGLSPGRHGSRVQLFEAREGGPSEAVATMDFASTPRGRTPKVLRFRAGEFPVAVLQDQSVVVADE